MSRFILGSFLVTLVTFALSPRTSAAEPGGVPDTPLTVRIRLYDYAGLPRGTLKEAQETASLALRHAGVETVWMQCPISSSIEATASACGLPQGLADIVIRTLPERMVERVEVFRDYYGFAWPAAEGRYATVASVFHDRIAALARDEGYSKATLLGYLIAHEMGHLLLGTGSHSVNGLMRHPWRHQELEKAVRGTLRFSARQCRQIRQNVRARMRMSERTKMRVQGR